MPANILEEVTELICAAPQSGAALSLYALMSTLRMDKTGHMYMLRKLRDLTPDNRERAYRLMELMAQEGNQGEAWDTALDRMDTAIRGG